MSRPPMRGLELTRTVNAEAAPIPRSDEVAECADAETASQLQPLIGASAIASATGRGLDTESCRQVGDITRLDRYCQTTASPINPLLPPELRLLFAIGGASMALPMTALLFLVNTRTPLPVNLLPAYGALCFLPYALKPVLALLTQVFHQHVLGWGNRKPPGPGGSWDFGSPLLPVLLLLHAAALVATACWADTRVGLFAVGFLRGLTSAWTELLLELQVVHHVLVNHPAATAAPGAGMPPPTPSATVASDALLPTHGDRSRAATRLQAQAATARNAGSWTGHLLATVWLLAEHGYAHRAAMTAGTAARLLSLTALLNVVGSLYACRRRTGSPVSSPGSPVSSHGHRSAEARDSPDYVTRTEPLSVQSSKVRRSEVSGSPADACEAGTSSTRHNRMNKGVKTTCLLQCFVILLVFREPWCDSRAAWLWYILLALAMLILLWETVKFISSSARFSQQKSIQYRAGFCLILRNAMPTASYLLASYVYGTFESHPVDVQILTLVDMGVLTLGSWSFGLLYGNSLDINRPKIAKKVDAQHDLYRIMITTTFFATVVTLIGQLILLKLIPLLSPSHAQQLGMAILIQSLVTIFGEWKFLPEVILATIASLPQPYLQEMETSSWGETSREAFVGSEPSPEQLHEQITNSELKRLENCNCSGTTSTDVCYGSLTSCIDLGSQISTIVVSLLVNALRISREDNWKNLDHLVEIGALGSFLSIAWIYLLLRPSSKT